MGRKERENQGREFQNKTAIDYKSNTVGIKNILIDFNNTLIAIGAPDEIQEEVKLHLKLIEIESQKQKPDKENIKTDLKNAAKKLDKYIEETLKKPSKVVSDWVSALLLQNIDYKAPPKVEGDDPFSSLSTVNPEKEIVLSENDKARMQEVATETVVPKQIDPSKLKLRKASKAIEKHIEAGNYEKALDLSEKAIKLAEKTGNDQLKAKIHMDRAFIHDTSYDLELSLFEYQKAFESANIAGDKKIEAKAHYNIGTIYDDTGKVDLALDHYFTALSLDGETENLKGQALTLNNIGNMHSVRGEYKPALNYYKLAFGLAKEQDDKEGMASILSNTAGVFRDLKMDKKALDYYKKAAQLDFESGNVSGYAKTLELSGDILSRNNEKVKAQRLYKKSMLVAHQIGDTNWSARMADKIKLA